ncbi:MAG: hypothetical protein J5824_08460 [Lachnospiraceae bacterium]|nr:hypothetical protein [Lachnospiraceae bacterium]
MDKRTFNNSCKLVRMGRYAIILLLTVLWGFAIYPSKVQADTQWVDFTITCDGNLTGQVGSPIEPYYFTIEMHDATFGLSRDYADGEDVTSWFTGFANESGNYYVRTPVGLVFKTVGAIHNGDTVGHFVVTGTPWFAASHYLEFKGVPYNHTFNGGLIGPYPSLTGSVKFNIVRGNYGEPLSLNPSPLKITGQQGTPITPVTLVIGTGGNFIATLPAGEDISSWFRSEQYYVDWEHDQNNISALLPRGLKATLKKAIKLGDTSFTVEISGTPQHGSKDFIVWEAPKEYIAYNGSAKTEQGYGFTGIMCKTDYRYNISGDDITPTISVDPVRVEAIVGDPVPDNLVTFRLHNCTLTKTLAAGTNITGWFVQYDVKHFQWFGYALEKFGSSLKVEIVRFVSGEDYFTCKFTGTAKVAGAAMLRLFLENSMTSHSVRVWSGAYESAYFVASDPDLSPKAYISERTLEMKTGFTVDTSDDVFVAGIMGGTDAESHDVVYALDLTDPTSVNKNTDVSSWFIGLPAGVKAYAAEKCKSPSQHVDDYRDTLLVYFKGVPQKAGTYNVRFKLKREDYRTITSIEEMPGGLWVHWGYSDYGNIESDTALTVVVTDADKAAYAFDNSKGEDIAQLKYEDFIEAVDEEPVFLNGNIATVKYVEVTDGTALIRNVDSYSIEERSFGIFVPKITTTRAYNAGEVVNDLVRLKNSPLSNYTIRTDGDISKGTQCGLVLSVCVSNEDITITPSMDELEVQIFDGSSWRDVKMPTGSSYAIGETIYGDATPDTSKCAGLSASIADCSINGISWNKLMDREGIEITVNGAVFKDSIAVKNTDVTGWFKNLPKALKAVVKENAGSNSKKLKIVFTRVKDGAWQYLYPESICTDPIRVTIPLSALNASNGNPAPWQKLNGGVVTTLNENAVWNILSSSTATVMDKPIVVSNTMTGVYKAGSQNGIGTDSFSLYVYLPRSAYAKLMEEVEARRLQLQEYPENFQDWSQEDKDRFLQPDIRVSLRAEDGLFKDINDPYLDHLELYGSTFQQISSDGLYGVNVSVGLRNITASKLAAGSFAVGVFLAGEEVELNAKNTYVYYRILDKLPDEQENGSENGDDVVPSGAAPDIWVNGKDNKKEEIYKKSMTKAVSELISSLPDDCKYVLSVTDTTVEDADAAFSSGKGKKSDIAKASYKKADDAVVVTAGKKEGTARIWIAAVDKKKAVQASGYFDVLVGMAPKKIYITKEKGADVKDAVKSVALSTGESVWLYANANGTELSSHAKFTWTATKGADNLEITPSASTQSAKISVKAAPTDGKVIKATVTMMNVESGKKVNCSVMIVNEVVSITGLSTDLTLESALEAAVEKQLDYKFVCADGGETTTDKIKVYTTAALDEGTGYSNNGNKFTISSKSKIKITYKNSEFKLKAAKKTANGTKCRILVVVTHSDKTIDVFESGVITVGRQNN